MAIQVPPDSTGKTVRTKTDSGSQEQQVVTLGDGTDTTNVAVLSDMDTGAGTELALNVSLRKSASGGSVEAGTSTNPLRVDPTGTTIQPVSDGGSTLSIDDGAGSLTVDGTVGISGTVTVDGSGVTQPVSDAGGSLTVDDGGGSLTVDGTVGISGTPTVQESLGVTIQRVSSNPAASGDNTIIAAPGVGQSIYVTAYSISFSGTVNAKITDGAAGTQLTFLYGIANSGGGESTKAPGYLFKLTSNTALVLNLSAATAVAVNISYFVA